MRVPKRRFGQLIILILFALNARFCQASNVIDGLYTVEEQSKRLTQQIGDASVKPVKARSPTECILKCRIQMSEGFFVEEQQNCYCLRKYNEREDLSSTTDGQIDGKLYKKHQVRINWVIFQFTTF